MGYYMGDYYRGDYYRGDPGIWSFVSGLAKKAVGLIPGVGPIASTAIQAVERSRAGTLAARAGGAITRGVLKHPVLSAAGAAGAVGAIGMGAAGRIIGPGGEITAMRGYHMSKPTRTSPSHLVRNRRMRVTNPRALRRSLRRVAGFSRLARRVLHFTHPRSKGRLAYRFPKRRKK